MRRIPAGAVGTARDAQTRLGMARRSRRNPWKRALALCACAASLLLVAACDETNAPTVGTVRVSVTTTGGDVDLDGYSVMVDGASPQTVPVNETVVISSVPSGAHAVALSDVAANCTVAGQNPRPVTVTGGETVEVGFVVSCVATGVQVTTATTGVDIDADGYAVSLDGAPPLAIPVNGTVSITRLSAGNHTVTLSGMVGNCVAAGGNSRAVDVGAGDVVSVGFPVTCGAVSGVIEVTATTSGIDRDADGYTVQVGDGTPQPLPANGIVRFSGVGGGEHQVSLAGAATNCTAAGDNPRTVSVTTGGLTRDTARTTFQVTCVATTGVIKVTAATSGVDFDPDGYTVQVDAGQPRSLPVNGSAIFEGLGAGNHTVTLAGAATNCTAAGDNPRTVSVTTGGLTRDTSRTTFEVTCLSTVGSIRVATATSGADLDPNGYTVFVDEQCYYDYYGYPYCDYSWTGTVGVNGSVTSTSLPMGEHTVQLADVAQNCTVAGANPRTVTVPPGDVVQVAFAVSCVALGSMQVAVTTTGGDLDPNGYSALVHGVNFSTSRAVPTNGTITIAQLVPGDYTVQLADVAQNCDVTSPNPLGVTVLSGGTTPVAFNVGCTPVKQLAVVASADGNDEIFIVNSNGTGLTRLTTNSVSDGDPAWSPDGSKIAFRSARDGNHEIYVMNADGSNPARLTSNSAADYQPTWSPDGSRIAFVSERDGNAEIYVMNAADGSNPVRLTTDVGTPAFDGDPAWSPDGSKIAFWSRRDGNGEIYVMNPDGLNVTRLTTNAVDDLQPAWSPDGSRLVFSRFTGCDSYSGFCDYDLFVMNADGSGAVQRTSGSSDNDPAWSPDGGSIAFGASFCDYYYYYYGCYFSYRAVHLVRADGTGVVELMRDAFQPAWRP